jgi:beta-phosphoglucomutase
MDLLGVIFDMDGVLVDSYEAHFASWRRMAARHGLDMTRDEFAATFGRTTRDIIRHLWGDRGIPDDEIPAWDAEKEAAYRQILEADFPAMDGAGELLAALHEAGFALAIGSSGPPENVALVLRCLGGAEHVAATVDGTQVTRGKPHPEVFLKAADKLRLPPAACAVVEDAPAGIEAARRAGMAAIALTGTAPREKLARRAHRVVGSLRELTPQIVRALIRDSAAGSA